MGGGELKKCMEIFWVTKFGIWVTPHIDENSFIKFELNPITIKGPKLEGKFFGPVTTRNLQFAFRT